MSGYDFKLLGNIFKEGIYEVPEYQRNYAWKEQQLKDVWEDLENIDLGTDFKHYTGTIVVENVGDIAKYGKTYRKFKIIDGQQRLATLTILLFCIYEKIKVINSTDGNKTAENIFSEYIYDSSIDLHKLVLNGGDSGYLKDVVLKIMPEEMAGNKPQTPSQKRLKDAKEFFREKVSDKDFDYLNNLINKITTRMLFIRYEVGSELEAGLVFEVMNDRGKTLTQVDKIKNYLISLAYKKDDTDLAMDINKTWGVIFRNLMEIDAFSEDDLLRYHWIMLTGEAKTYDVYRTLKDRCSLKNENLMEDSRDYITTLKEASYVFKELNNPEDSFVDWTGTTVDNMKKYLLGLHRLKNTATFMPLLIASRKIYKADPESFHDIVRLCEIFAFRVYKVGNKRTNTKYSMFCRHAKKLFDVRDGDDSIRKKICEEIKNDIREAIAEYGNEEEFVNNLKRDRFYPGWVEGYEIKYLLYELECKKCLDAGEGTPKWSDISSSATQIEHIWPQKPRGYDEWGDGEKEHHERYVHKLGNLTLTYWNQNLSNKDFVDKREKYKESNLKIQKELWEQHSKWGIEEIDNRTEDIINFVKTRWGIV